MKIDLTRDELRIIMAAVYAGVQALGMQIVVPLAPVLIKLDQAVQAANEEAGNGATED